MYRMHFTTLVRTAAFALALSAPAFPAAAHAQVVASLTGDAALGIGSSTASADVRADADANAPLVVTRASARADLGAAAVPTAAATGSDERASLKTRANLIASGDSHVSSVSLSSKDVAVSYREPAKLFGLIRVTVPVTVRVEASGSTHVSYPWYGFMLSSNQAALAIRIQAAAQNALSASSTADAGLSVAEQSRLLDSIHAMLESSVEASATGAAVLQP